MRLTFYEINVLRFDLDESPLFGGARKANDIFWTTDLFYRSQVQSTTRIQIDFTCSEEGHRQMIYNLQNQYSLQAFGGSRIRSP